MPSAQHPAAPAINAPRTATASTEELRLALDNSRVRIEELELQNERLQHKHNTLLEQTGCLEELCDLMPIGYLRLSRHGHILDANRAAVQLLGIYRTNMRMRSFIRFVCDDHKASYQMFHDKVVATGLISKCEVKLKSLRGQEFWAGLTSSWAPVKGTVADVASEDAKDLIVMIHDITERKLYETHLREQKRLFQSVLNNLPSMIGYWDKDLHNRFGNHAYAAWFGVDPQSMPGKHIREVIGEERYRLNLPYIEAALRGEYQEFERDIPAPDGSRVRHSWAQYIPDCIDGEVVGFFVQVTDVTNTKNKERALMEAQHIGHVGSYEYDIVKDQWTSSPELDRIFGFSRERARRGLHEWIEVIPADVREELVSYWQETLAHRSKFDREYPIIRANDGELRWVHGIGDVLRSPDNTALRMAGTMQDITERRTREVQLTSHLALLRLNMHALNQISQGVLITGIDCAITFANEAFEVISGYPAADILGQTCKFLQGPLSQVDVIQEIHEALVHARSFEGEIINYRKDGTPFWNELSITPVFDGHGDLSQFVGVQRDISPRKATDNQIFKLAFYDSLTETPNRSLLISRLQLLLTDAAKQSDYCALIMLDLDHFKVVNETLGHALGDQMLIEASHRIRACIRKQDTVAHVSGDEFMVLFDGLEPCLEAATKEVASIAESIREALATPFDLNGQEFLSSASFGVCMFCVHEVTAHDVLKRSDIAMYRAKSGGRNTLRFFDSEMQTELESHAALESDLRRAVRDQQLDLHFQIQVDDRLRPIGAEVLVRWDHLVRGMVSPNEFIPVAEESSLILSLGRWVLESACRQLGVWSQHENTRQLTLAVNISARQFTHTTLVDDIAEMLQVFGVDASRLKLELTESVVLNDIDDVVRKMHGLKALGVTLSMDDFGTGYSSLSCLKRLPMDQIKIDQSFVRGITSEQSDYVMVKTIIDMAKNFHVDVIAEGVETEAQRSLLQHLGCESYQGYLFGKPMPIAKFAALLPKHALPIYPQ